MDDHTRLPQHRHTTATTLGRQRPQQQGVAATGSGNISSVQHTTLQGQRFVSEASSSSHQPRLPLHTHSIQNAVQQDHLPTTNPLTVQKFINQHTKHSNYCTYTDRLSTYNNYPPSIPQRPAALAEAGFYYAGHDDLVVCYQCGVQLDSWLHIHEPWEMHARWSDQCDYVKTARGQQFINDTKIKYTLPELFNQQANIAPMTQQEPVLATENSLPQPEHFAFNTTELRLGTFIGVSSFLHQTHKDLAEAGLLHNGEGDQTECFQCGGGIQHWEKGDIPLVEHLRWYPNCPYVHQKLDKESIKAFQVLFEEKGNLLKQKPSNEKPVPSMTDFISSDVYISVINCCPTNKNEIEKAFIYYLETGNKKPSAPQILTIVFSLTDDPEGEMSKLVMASYKKHMELIPTKKDISQNRLQQVEEEIQTIFLLSQERLEEKNLNIQMAADEELARQLHAEMQYETELPPSDEPRNDTTPLSIQAEKLSKPLCKICFKNSPAITCTPCGHFTTCVKCSEQIEKCPTCETYIEEKVKTYLA